jgi:hypothetical protein
MAANKKEFNAENEQTQSAVPKMAMNKQFQRHFPNPVIAASEMAAPEGSKQIAFLKAFNDRKRENATASLAQNSQQAAPSNDAVSSCSWSVVSDQ